MTLYDFVQTKSKKPKGRKSNPAGPKTVKNQQFNPPTQKRASKNDQPKSTEVSRHASATEFHPNRMKFIGLEVDIALITRIKWHHRHPPHHDGYAEVEIRFKDQEAVDAQHLLIAAQMENRFRIERGEEPDEDQRVRLPKLVCKLSNILRVGRAEGRLEHEGSYTLIIGYHEIDAASLTNLDRPWIVNSEIAAQRLAAV